MKNDGEALIRPAPKKVDEVFCILHKKGKKPIAVKEIGKGIKRKMKDKFK